MPRLYLRVLSRIKTKQRRTDAELRRIYDAMVRIVAADNPMTLRGLFYRLVVEGLIGKTEREYQNTGRYLLKLRREGVIPYGWIADYTRWMRKPTTDSGLGAALRRTADSYRRALWDDQPHYCEIWCEKATLAGVLIEETAAYDVPLMVLGGFGSETYLHGAAQTIRAAGKPSFLYLLTDHDPSGLASAADVERKIVNFLPAGFPVTVERIAVTEAQIDMWDLPTRPTKASDSRAATFAGESVELDAIPASELRSLVRTAIEQHLNADILARTQAIEEWERDALHAITENGWLAEQQAAIDEALVLAGWDVP